METATLIGKNINKIKARWRRRRDSNPRYRIYQYDGLANRWFQPLTHVSGIAAAMAGYSEGLRGRQEAIGWFFAAVRAPPDGIAAALQRARSQN